MGFMLGSSCSPCCGCDDIGDIYFFNRGVDALTRAPNTPQKAGIGPNRNLVGPNHPSTVRAADTGWVISAPGVQPINSRLQYPVVGSPFDEITDYPDGTIAVRKQSLLSLTYSDCVYRYVFVSQQMVAPPFFEDIPDMEGLYNEITLITSADSIYITARSWVDRFYADPLKSPSDNLENPCSTYAYKLFLGIRNQFCMQTWNNIDRSSFLENPIGDGNPITEDTQVCLEQRERQTVFTGPCFNRLYGLQERSCQGQWPPPFLIPAFEYEPNACTCGDALSRSSCCPGVEFPE